MNMFELAFSHPPLSPKGQRDAMVGGHRHVDYEGEARDKEAASEPFSVAQTPSCLSHSSSRRVRRHSFVIRHIGPAVALLGGQWIKDVANLVGVTHCQIAVRNPCSGSMSTSHVAPRVAQSPILSKLIYEKT
ncbi:hypothetical protein OsJ_35330 [Oryza sativa Japonica Group]|uniref:Uncharacterized protein n=1 Tax=Oryza sativa subsp. japonica TaxID=39947 RepID=B9GC12_ORYSJ|nr:hypothetical protein OsJ_35330 [Oryza sativa Japonica Group]